MSSKYYNVGQQLDHTSNACAELVQCVTPEDSIGFHNVCQHLLLVYKAYLTTTPGKELVVVKNGKGMYISDSMCTYAISVAS